MFNNVVIKLKSIYLSAANKKPNENNPAIVLTNNPDLDINDFTYSSTTLGLRYTEFISPLIKAVQELSAEVTSLKARVTELENN